MLRTQRLTVKLQPAHRTALENLARLDGESVAAVVRRLIRAEAQRRGFWPQPMPAANSTGDVDEGQVRHD